MKFNYIYGKQAEQYDYLYIPKAFMKEELFKSMTASAKIMYQPLKKFKNATNQQLYKPFWNKIKLDYVWNWYYIRFIKVTN